MLSEKINALFRLLSCNNSDIARRADCVPSNISRMRTGARIPKPNSTAAARLVRGIYGFAEAENKLPALCELCREADRSEERLTPALITWLYDGEPAAIPQGKSKANMRRSFGEKLSALMSLLELSNVRLARMINVDPSLVGRFRSGMRSPHGNPRISELMARSLLSRAAKLDKLCDIAQFCGIPARDLADEGGIQYFSEWLYQSQAASNGDVVDGLLEAFDAFTPADVPPGVLEGLKFEVKETYRGVDGLREAVLRFLTRAADEGGDLLLYSDEDMRWLSDDPLCFARWSALMSACVKKGVRIKIIHNVDRNAAEMIAAIKSWTPLYMSGMIEPFVCRKPRDKRFANTVFLRTGGEAVRGSYVSGIENPWYDYITDAERIDALAAGFERLLSFSEPMLKIFTGDSRRELYRNLSSGGGRTRMLLCSPSAGTMPQTLLERMISRQNLPDAEKKAMLDAYKRQKEMFVKALSDGVDEFAVLPEGEVRVNFGIEPPHIGLVYTREEYAEHLGAVVELLEKERNYRFCILTEPPFSNIQLILRESSVSMVRASAPFAAFVFTDSLLCRAVGDYFERLLSLCFDPSKAKDALARFL